MSPTPANLARRPSTATAAPLIPWPQTRAIPHGLVAPARSAANVSLRTMVSPAGAAAAKAGGPVLGGNPKSKVDDVSAKLQHGEFVIPRDAVHHLATTAPGVLSHVMQVSAAHALAQKAKDAMEHPAGPPQMAGGGTPTVYGRPASGLPPLARMEAARAAAAPGGGPMGAPPQGLKDGGPVGY